MAETDNENVFKSVSGDEDGTNNGSIQSGEKAPLLNGSEYGHNFAAAEQASKLQTNELQTFVNITKSIVGAGSFALPYCFKNMGIINGTLTVLVMGACSIYTTLMLIKSKKYIEDKIGANNLTYVDVAKFTYGQLLAVLVYLLMLLASLGVSASYLVFIGNTMHEVVPSISILSWKAICLAVVIPVSFFRSMKYLSFTSLAGTFSLVTALIVTVSYGFYYEMDQFKSNTPSLFVFDTYFNSFGSVAFLFCIQFLVIPIERAMSKPENFWRPLNVSVFLITIFNILFALAGYQFWGENTCDIILGNMEVNTLTQIVKVTVCIDLVFTYPLVFAPGREIVENALIREGSSWVETKRNIIRVILVMVTFGFAQIQQFSVITNLVGIPMSTLAFVLPPLMDIKLHGIAGLAWYQRIIYLLLVIVGVFACVITTVYSFAFPAPQCVGPVLEP